MADHIDGIVEGWRRQRPDIDVAALALLARLFRTAHLADAVLAEQLTAHGLQRGWFDLLAAPHGFAVRAKPNPADAHDNALLRRNDQAAGSPRRGRSRRAGSKPQ